MDAVQIIEADHRQVERSFEQFERAVLAGDERGQGRLARKIVRDLSVHAALEEQVLYPALARAGVAAARLDALEDHHAVKVSLSEIEAMTPRQERFAAKVRLVARTVRRHVQEEEATLLPQLRKALDREALQRLGAELEALRRSAPTRPHPAAPDTPPANLFANAVASLVDRLRDALAEGGELLRSTVQQLLRRSFRAGRDAAVRAREGGEGLLEEARERGERLVKGARVLGTEVAGDAAERGSELAERIEHRTALASRELKRGARAAGVRARGAQGKRASTAREHVNGVSARADARASSTPAPRRAAARKRGRSARR